jgi:hypothetical protein
VPFRGLMSEVDTGLEQLAQARGVGHRNRFLRPRLSADSAPVQPRRNQDGGYMRALEMSKSLRGMAEG